MKQLLFFFTLNTPPPPTTSYHPKGPNGATLGTVMNNFYSSPIRRYLHTKELDCSTSASGEEDVWNLHSFGPWGPPPGPPWGHGYHLKNFESPTPKNHYCQVSVISDHAFLRRRWHSYFYIELPPPPTCYAPQGPNGATLGTVMNNFYSTPKKVSTH